MSIHIKYASALSPKSRFFQLIEQESYQLSPHIPRESAISMSLESRLLNFKHIVMSHTNKLEMLRYQLFINMTTTLKPCFVKNLFCNDENDWIVVIGENLQAYHQ